MEGLFPLPALHGHLDRRNIEAVCAQATAAGLACMSPALRMQERGTLYMSCPASMRRVAYRPRTPAAFRRTSTFAWAARGGCQGEAGANAYRLRLLARGLEKSWRSHTA